MSVIFGDANSAYELLYGGIQDSAITEVQGRIQSLANAGLGVSQSFIESTKALFNRVASHDVVRQARRAVAGVQAFSAANSITVLSTVNDFQLAKSENRRWLAANPYFQELMGERVISAWGEKFTDNQPGFTGMERRDFRLATSGVEQVDEENERFIIAQFTNEQPIEGEAPSVSQMFDINKNWANFRRLHLTQAAEGGEDITDEFGELL